jgi:hypothetical protein
MAVLIEAFSVVIRCDAIEARFVGGMQGLARTIPNNSACRDQHLVRVAFMDSADADAYISVLVERGLVAERDRASVDLAPIMQNKGITVPAEWLKYREIESNGTRLSICWRTGTEPGEIAVPKGWTYDNTMTWMPTSFVGDRLKFLRMDGGVEVYLDLQTSKELYVGRSTISGDTPEALQTQLRRIIREAKETEESGPLPARPRLWGRQPDPRFTKLTNELLPEVERIAKGPGRELASAHYARGVVLQLLHRVREAADAFIRAHELAPDLPGVLRDLVRCLGEQKRPREALPYARKAVALDSTDTSDLGNLAACLMQCGQLDEATRVIDQALALNPEDQINNAIRQRLRQLARR